ncbi:hypothetical protein HTVC168P_gp41 [Pelagibacter phage HTVC168P]|nr:hypothetical protein HTVC168P_gp41 [Pelagibacter phage HTVC168P]
MSNARDKANIPALNFSSTGIDDNATSTAITINSSEQVGIGITTPGYPLQINSSAQTTLLHLVSTAGTSSAITFANTGSNDSITIGAENDDLKLRTDDGVIKFFTNENSEKMRIDSSGNVGIGTTSPQQLINIESTGNAKIRYGYSSTVYGEFGRKSNGVHEWSSYENGGDLSFGTSQSNGSTTERMRIEANGNIGIGTSTPAHNLEIVATASGSINDSLQIRNNTTTTGSGSRLRFITSTDENSDANGASIASVRNGNDNDLVFEVENAEAMRIDHAGYVGIGNTVTNSGNAYLTVKPTSTNGRNIAIYTSGSVGNNAGIFFNATEGSGNLAEIKGEYVGTNTGHLKFNTSMSERMRITSAGKVGIGDTAPSGILEVSDADNETYLIVTNAKSGGSGQAILTLRNDVGNWQVKCDTNDTFKIRDNAGATDIVSIDSSSNVQIGNASTSGNGYNLTSSLKAYRNTTSQQEQIEFYNPNGIVGTIKTDGTTTSYNTSSDYRLKENVNYDFDATSRLKQLKPARFNFIADANKILDGFLAHEVSSVVPEAITGTKDAVDEDGNPKYQGIDQSKLVPLLVKTIQELEARITTLEANNP